MIKHIQLACLLSLTLLYADLRFEVIGSDLNISIDDSDEYSVTMGWSNVVECQQPIEVLAGSGELIITNNNKPIKRLKKGDEAFIIPAHKCQSSFKKLSASLFKSIKTFINTNETASSGISKGVGDNAPIEKNITIPKEYIMLYSNKWGYSNYRLEIFRGDKVIKKMEFDDKNASFTYFVLPVKELKTNDKYKVYNCIENNSTTKCPNGEELSVGGVITIE